MSNFNLTYQKDGENEQLYYKDVHNNDLYIRSCEDFAPAIIQEKSGNPIAITDGADCPIRKLKVIFEPIQEGSGDPSPDNVRPISGRDSVTVTRTGKNLFDQDAKYASFKQADGSFIGVMNPNITSVHTAIPSAMVGKEVTFSAKMKVPSGSTIGNLRVGAKVGGVVQNGTLVNSSDYSLSYITFTPSSADDYVYLSFGSSGTQQVQFKDVMLALGTDTAYEPYDGASVTVQLGQTVYGGNAEIISGQGRSTMHMVDLGTLRWDYFDSKKVFYAATASYPKKYGFTNIISSAYKTRTATSGTNWTLNDKEIGGASNAYYIYIKDTAYSDAEDFKTAMSGVQACYELNTPVEFTTDPVTLSTLKGENTFSTDGTSIELEYVVDTKTYIDNLINSGAKTVVKPNDEIKIIDENKGVE